MSIPSRQRPSPLGFEYADCRFLSDQVPNVRRACFRVRKVLEGVVHDTVALEGNPFTLPEVKTLLDGVTVGGHRLSDEKQVLNQAASWRELLSLVESGAFKASLETLLKLHALVAREEALTWGEFRDGPVSIAGTERQPPSWETLPRRFERGLRHIAGIRSAYERGIAAFLFYASHQFFYDGNKRTGRLMMNGELLSAGLDAISVPANQLLQFNAAMIRFYDSQDGTEMMGFMASCSLDETLRVELDGTPAPRPL